MLAETAEILSSTAQHLEIIVSEEWMIAEEAATYLERTPEAFEKIVAKGEILKHYLTERGIFFPARSSMMRSVLAAAVERHNYGR